MPEITCQFWDVGGVLLTNGWDRDARNRATTLFNLDEHAFEARHAQIVDAFEKGQISLEAYLKHAIFYVHRSFTPEDFKTFMFSCSRPNTESLALVASVAASRSCLMATLNNESLELNQFRIEEFRLREYFDVFLTSRHLGIVKPDPAMYRLALKLVGRKPDECLVVDDRESNLATARSLQIRTICYRDPVQLRAELALAGVTESEEVSL